MVECFYKNRLLRICKKIYELSVNKTFYAQIIIYRILRKEFKDFKKVIFISNLYYCNALTLLVQKKLKNVSYIMKVCTKCGEEKDYSEFHKHKTSKDGYRTICKECRKQADKLYYNENSSHIRQRVKEFRGKNKNYLITNKKYRENNKEFVNINKINRK